MQLLKPGSRMETTKDLGQILFCRNCPSWLFGYAKIKTVGAHCPGGKKQIGWVSWLTFGLTPGMWLTVRQRLEKYALGAKDQGSNTQTTSVLAFNTVPHLGCLRWFQLSSAGRNGAPGLPKGQLKSTVKEACNGLLAFTPALRLFYWKAWYGKNGWEEWV